MALDMLRVLVKTPELNSVDRKARSVPILNPRYTHGRVFFSWLGFLNAFLSWHALWVFRREGEPWDIICDIIFRYCCKEYHTVMWIIGVPSIVLNLAVCWIRPMPKEALCK